MNNFLVLLLLQCLALALPVTAVLSKILTLNNVYAPATQNCLAYFLLSFYFVINWYYKKKDTTKNDNIHYNSQTIKSNNIRFDKDKNININTNSNSPFSNTHLPIWGYALIGFCDFEGNYLLVLAYQYTTIASVQLLDCFTIPILCLFSYLIFRRVPFLSHYIGMVICIFGVFILVYADFLYTQIYHHSSSSTNLFNININISTTNILESAFHSQNQTKHSSMSILYGDLLVLLGTVFYAVSNLMQEYVMSRASISNSSLDNNDLSKDEMIIKNIHVNEYLLLTQNTQNTKIIKNINFITYCEWIGFVSFFGFIFSLIQAFIFEKNELKFINWNNSIIIYCFILYALTLFITYSLVPPLIQRSSALILNLSFLSSDFWSLLVSTLLFNDFFSGFYFCGFIFILIGVVIYNIYK